MCPTAGGARSRKGGGRVDWEVMFQSRQLVNCGVACHTPVSTDLVDGYSACALDYWCGDVFGRYAMHQVAWVVEHPF